MNAARAACLAAFLMLSGMLAGCERTPTEQHGYRGLGMMEVGNARARAAASDLNTVPTPLRRVSASGPTAGEEYSNVLVLGDLSKPEFARLMLSIKSWIAPDEGCPYCHNVPDYASDAKPTKLVARAMLLMTREINTRLQDHVKGTGVTCYTCHRGQAIPPKVWYASPPPAQGMLSAPRSTVGMPTPSAANSLGLADTMSEFLLHENPIRVVSTAPLKQGNPKLIHDARLTYSLMTVISESLGVNCTFCHNTRAFADWSLSTPQRVTAWHGIRMARELNRNYLEGLATLLPPEKLGPAGDGPKIYCATCHAGINRPLNGVNMVRHFPELIGSKADLAATAPPAAMLAAAAQAPSPSVPARP